jgi:poly(hydroxyalkanoate) depolymerase family esterase
MRAIHALWTVAGLLLASGPAAGPSGALEPGHSMSVTSGEFREGEYSDQHGTRRYRLYVPSGSQGTGRPLVVMLHGCTQDPEDFAAGTRANERAEAAGLIVLYPEQPATANPQKCWSWFDPAHQGRGAGEPALLAGLTRQAVAETGADPDRVFIAGISAGGSMAQILAAAYPELFAGLAVHSAPAFGSARDVAAALAVLQQGAPDPETLPERVLAAMGERARPVPTIVLHGQADAVVRAMNGEQALRQWAGVAVAAARPESGKAGSEQQAAGAEPAAAACPAVRGLAGECTRVEAKAPARRCVYRGGPVGLEYWLVEGMGHAWSGGSSDGSYTDSAGPDATEQVFRFFLEQPGRDS